MAGNPDADGIKGLKVSLFGATTLINQSYFFDSTYTTHANMGWVFYEFNFTANGSWATLDFTSMTGSSPYGPAIAGVNLSTVPIPAAAWMLGAGLVGLVAVRRRKYI
jgi:hypothetical protein